MSMVMHAACYQTYPALGSEARQAHPGVENKQQHQTDKQRASTNAAFHGVLHGSKAQ